MRITFLKDSLHTGGTERQLVALAAGLHERGHRVLVATFYGGGPLEKDLHEAGVPVRSLEKRGRWDFFGFLLRLARLVREERPEILHGYLGVPNVVTVLLKPLFPRARMVWGLRASNVDLGRYHWLMRLSYKVERRLARFADLIIVNSHAGRDYAVKNGFPKNKMVVIPNGIDTHRFRPDAGAGRRVREEWGVTEGEKLVGQVGRLDPMKDQSNFLRAVALLAREREDVRFVCVGDGPDRRKLHALGEELGLAGRLIWAGARVDVPAVYNALDVFASSSYTEGFSNVIGEAMSCGVPCVVTDAGDSARIVGETGIVVPPEDPEGLAGGLKKMLNRLEKLNDPYPTRTRITRRFSLESLISNTEETLTRLAER